MDTSVKLADVEKMKAHGDKKDHDHMDDGASRNVTRSFYDHSSVRTSECVCGLRHVALLTVVPTFSTVGAPTPGRYRRSRTSAFTPRRHCWPPVPRTCPSNSLTTPRRTPSAASNSSRYQATHAHNRLVTNSHVLSFSYRMRSDFDQSTSTLQVPVFCAPASARADVILFRANVG